MKRITSNKKGFTLLEVMLSVAIMAISSTMIMVGFLTTMTYSRNSALYSKVGASNYTGCITALADMKSNSSSIFTLNNSNPGPHTVSVLGNDMTPTGASINWGGRGTSTAMYIRLTGNTEGVVSTTGDGYNAARVVGGGTSFHTEYAEGDQDGGSSYGGYNDFVTYSDNRTSLFYYHEVVCPICVDAGVVSNISYRRIGTDTSTEGFYCTNTHTDAQVAALGWPADDQNYVRVAHLDGSGNIVRP